MTRKRQNLEQICHLLKQVHQGKSIAGKSSELRVLDTTNDK